LITLILKVIHIKGDFILPLVFFLPLTLEKIKKRVNRDNNLLDLSQCNICNDDIPLICTYLNNHPEITTLDVSNNKIRAEGAKALALNKTITTLELFDNKIEAIGAKALANNKTITRLDVSGNHIGDEGAIDLAQNNTITTLSVEYNQIGVEGAIALALNKTITNLNLRLNNIGAKDANILVDTLKSNTTLVSFTHHFAEKSLKETIEKILTRNKVTPCLNNIINARLMAQAQRTENCPLGTIPKEIAGIINDYSLGTNHYSFFLKQYDKRPSEDDLKSAKQETLIKVQTTHLEVSQV
jgi:Leucine Rich repeat